MGLEDDVKKGIDNGIKFFENLLFGGITNLNGTLYQMGRISTFHHSVDRDHRISNFLKSKMNVIDLLPAQFKMDFTSALQKSPNGTTDATGLMPKIDYGTAMGLFQKDCTSYGLTPHVGIRLYTTDETSASDSISNTRKENLFEGMINNIGSGFSSIRDMIGSAGVDLSPYIGKAKTEAGNLAQKGTDLLGGLAGLPPELKNALGPAIGNLSSTIAGVMLEGNRISFPTIWDNSDYMPGLSVNVKLMSPYGHPQAIKKFIIEPLSYLLILASPKTSDGVSYGKPHCCSITAYGMGNIPIGSIRSISLRRGGADTSFNLFCQPLTIDVNIEFEYLVKGFATYRPKAGSESHLEGSLMDQSTQPLAPGAGKVVASITTLGDIINSLRPIADKPTVASHSEFVKYGGTSDAIIKAQQALAAFQEAKKSVENIVKDIPNDSQNRNLDTLYA